MRQNLLDAVPVSSVRRWEIRLYHYRMTGGAPSISLLLAICLYIYPHASSDEIAAFIVANGGDTYSCTEIPKRCKEIYLIRKACSHEAYCASLSGNTQKAVWFVTLPPPLGVRGLRLD